MIIQGPEIEPDAFGWVLSRLYSGDGPGFYDLIRHDGFRIHVERNDHFGIVPSFSEFEEIVLKRALSPTVELCAGSGTFTLELQRAGLSACATDSSSKCVRIMIQRGIERTMVLDVNVDPLPMSRSVIMLDYAVGAIRNESRLRSLFDRCFDSLEPDGTLFIHNCDPRLFRSHGLTGFEINEHGQAVIRLDLIYEGHNMTSIHWSVFENCDIERQGLRAGLRLHKLQENGNIGSLFEFIKMAK